MHLYTIYCLPKVGLSLLYTHDPDSLILTNQCNLKLEFGREDNVIKVTKH